jgi:signal transduction histidine kinase/ActR/RegA family two-component response regulator
MVPGVPVTLEGIHTRKDGTTFPVEVRVGVFEARGSKRILGLVRDITQRKRMEEQLIQSEKLRAVGEMASGVAHDFNNALAVILGNAQLLLHTADNEELRETLKIIEKVAKESAQTVRRLQDFTRKRVHQEFFSLDLNSIIRDSIEISRPRWKDEAQNRGIHIEIVTNLKKIPPVIGNDSELREVIANIIFNSIEAMPEGGNIEIQTFQRKGKDYIQISDAGIGMKEEDRKKIFEPFFTTKPFSNAGLGLSMSYGIIKRMGGEIDVESKPGKGTTFTISLPIHFDSKEEMATESVTPSAPLSVEKTGPRILVIDDEESVRGMLFRMLKQVSHQVQVARNGEEGLQLFHENEFDMVVTDLGMPGMSGWDVCRAVKKMNPRTSVGMITGWGMEISQKQAKESGLDFLISKPFDFKEILRRIEETMESKGI